MTLKAIGAVAAVLSLSACAGEQIVGRTARDAGVPQAEINALAFSGRQVEVLGAPPDGSGPEAVAALVRVPGFRNDTPFRVLPAGSPGLRVVLEFGVTVGTESSCVQPRGSAQTGPMQLTATLCRDQRFLSNATMRSASLRGPTDPQFQGAMDRLMQSLLPPERFRLVID